MLASRDDACERLREQLHDRPSLVLIPHARPASKPWGGRSGTLPADAHRRPLLDDRRAGGYGCLLGQASVAIDRAAPDGRG